MAGRDGSLHLVRAGSAAPQGGREQSDGLGDLGMVPPRAVLLVEQHQVPGTVHPGVAPGVLQEEQREQSLRLRLVGHEPDDGPGEVDRFGAQPGPHQIRAGGRGVSLVEQQVQHGEHTGGALGEQVVRRHPVGDARLPDLALRPHEPLGHRGLRHEERAGDLAGRQTGEGTQRQRHPGLDRQRRVAAREDQA